MRKPVDNKIRILFISLYAEMGGGEYGLYYLLKNIDRTRFQPVVVANRRGPFVENVEAIGVETVIMPFEAVMLQRLIIPGIFWKNLKVSLAIKRYLAAQQVDLVQCSDVLGLLLVLPAVIRYRLPVIFSVIFIYEGIRALLVNLLALFAVRRIVMLSKMVQDDFLSKTVGLKKKCRLIYWGVDSSRFHPVAEDEKRSLRERLGLPTGKKIIGFVGRYDTWKGHGTFLDASQQLLKTRSDLFFLIVGGAPTADAIPGVARYRAAVMDRIRSGTFNGNLMVWDHRNDIPEVMACMDVIVCPSDREPFGLVVLEAIACGVPVVVSRAVGALEVLDGTDGVYIAEPKDSLSFAMAIERALNGTMITTDGSGKYRRLTWDRYAREYEALYDSIQNRKTYGSPQKNSAAVEQN